MWFEKIISKVKDKSIKIYLYITNRIDGLNYTFELVVQICVIWRYFYLCGNFLIGITR